jgi:hypothetical protein
MPGLRVGCVIRLPLLVFMLLVVLAYLNSYSVMAEGLDDVVGSLVRDLEELKRSRVDVSGLVASLDEAVRLWESGDVEGASRVLESVRFEVERLKGEAPRVYALHVARVTLTVLALLAIPPLFYMLFPRLYLRLWFNSRRGWVVVRGAPRR